MRCHLENAPKFKLLIYYFPPPTQRLLLVFDLAENIPSLVTQIEQGRSDYDDFRALFRTSGARLGTYAGVCTDLQGAYGTPREDKSDYTDRQAKGYEGIMTRIANSEHQDAKGHMVSTWAQPNVCTLAELMSDQLAAKVVEGYRLAGRKCVDDAAKALVKAASDARFNQLKQNLGLTAAPSPNAQP